MKLSAERKQKISEMKGDQLVKPKSDYKDLIVSRVEEIVKNATDENDIVQAISEILLSVDDKFIPIQNVKEMLGCTERHIYDLIIESEIKGIKMGSRAVRISEKSLCLFIDRKTIKPEDLFDPDLEKQEMPTRTQPPQVVKSRWVGSK